MSKVKQTRLEKYLNYVANHRALSLVLLFGVCLAALAAFTENLTKLRDAGTSWLKHRSEKPQLKASLMLRIGGFEVSIANTSDTLATQVYVDVLTWQIGAPGPDVRQTFPVHDLPPHSDVTLEMGTLRRKITDDDKLDAGSGYIVVACGNADHPRAWAFHLPVPGSEAEQKFFRINPWPIVEFEYPAKKPPSGCCVNYPKGVCTGVYHSFYAAWNPPDVDKR